MVFHFQGIIKIVVRIVQIRSLYLNPIQNSGQLMLTTRLTLSGFHFGQDLSTPLQITPSFFFHPAVQKKGASQKKLQYKVLATCKIGSENVVVTHF